MRGSCACLCRSASVSSGCSCLRQLRHRCWILITKLCDQDHIIPPPPAIRLSRLYGVEISKGPWYAMDTSVRILPPSSPHSPVLGTGGLTLLCCYCRTELSEAQMFEFRDWVACESCIRDYYRDRPNELESELRTRQRNALVWLARNRRILQKHAVKK